MQREEHISMIRIMTHQGTRSVGVILTSMGWPYRVTEGQHLVCVAAQDQNNPPKDKTSSMRLFLRQAETSASSVRSLCCARADLREGGKKPAQLQQTWLCRHRRRARPWRQARLGDYSSLA